MLATLSKAHADCYMFLVLTFGFVPFVQAPVDMLEVQSTFSNSSVPETHYII